jgi:hypothetical protein
MVWALTRVVIHTDDENSRLLSDGTEFKLSELPESVQAGTFSTDEVRELDDALEWMEFD